MATKQSKKGKRYTDAEKAEIIDFVHKHNAANKRGGATAASKKFKVSQLTIGSWLKKSGKKPGKPGRKAAGRPASRSSASSSRSKVLDELAKADKEIAAKRRELEKLEAKFEKLKASL